MVTAADGMKFTHRGDKLPLKQVRGMSERNKRLFDGCKWEKTK